MGYVGALCPEHGRIDRVDEDGCCHTCGSAAVGAGIDEILLEVKRLKGVWAEALECLPEAAADLKQIEDRYGKE